MMEDASRLPVGCGRRTATMWIKAVAVPGYLVTKGIFLQCF